MARRAEAGDKPPPYIDPMDGVAALKILSAHRTGQVVLTHMSGIHDWSLVTARPELDVDIVRPMSKCADIALGLAIARPDIEFWVLDGDGSLLMNLGCLVTIAQQAPPNLVHFVYQNGTYDTTGGQPVPGGASPDFAAMALGAGYPAAASLMSLDDLEAHLPNLLAAPRPLLIALRVAPRPARPYRDVTGTGSNLLRLRRRIMSL